MLHRPSRATADGRRCKDGRRSAHEMPPSGFKTTLTSAGTLLPSSTSLLLSA